MSFINLGAYNTTADCKAMTNAIEKFGFSYSFELDKCYLIAGPRKPPSTIPTYAQGLNGAPPGQFFRYNKTEDGALTLHMCSQADCKVCNSPQTVEPNLCVTTPLGFEKYIAKTFLSDKPAFEEAPPADVDWSLFPPIAAGETPDSWRDNATLSALVFGTASANATASSTPLPSAATNATTTASSTTTSAEATSTPAASPAAAEASTSAKPSATAKPSSSSTSKKVTSTSTKTATVSKTVTVTASKTKTSTPAATSSATGEGRELATADVTNPRPDVDLRVSHQSANVAGSGANAAGPSLLAVFVAGLLVQAMLF